MTITATETEITMLEKLDASRVCTPFGITCDVEAVWLCIKMCGCELPFCDDHHRIAVIDIADWDYPGTIECYICKMKPYIRSEEDFCRWVRI